LKDNENQIKARVTAKTLNLINTNSPAEAGWFSQDFNVCLNGTCYAAIKENAVEKMKEGKKSTCSYCDNPLIPEKIGLIQIQFRKLE